VAVDIGSTSSGARLALLGVLLVAGAFVVSQALVQARLEYAVAVALAVVVFVLVFISPESGLYLVLLSMLLSPEFTFGRGNLSEMRQGVVIRFEDMLLMVIAISWFARTAVNKEMGVVVKTPLNRAILAYVATHLMATLLGYVTGSVATLGGFFYVLKYVEYFVVYYMTVNHLRDRSQLWRLVVTALATAAIVSVVGIAQIPSGERVTAPFEGDVGEPNTLGGYLLLTIAVAAGIALETRRLRVRVLSVGLVLLMALPFVFTLSRASYLGVFPLVAGLAVFSRHRRLLVGVLLVLVALAPVAGTLLVPAPVKQRVLETFRPEAAQQTVRIGKVAFDPSTSERLVSMRRALKGWIRRPILGYGVTGFAFMDAQYARSLVETGILGFTAFLWLMWGVLKAARRAFETLTEPEERGLALGFLAGTLALLAHAVGSNTFIIVRIMEPFWFFAAVVVTLPTLPAARPAPAGVPFVPARVRPAPLGARRLR
jgi:O-antigen ligase